MITRIQKKKKHITKEYMIITSLQKNTQFKINEAHMIILMQTSPTAFQGGKGKLIW